MTVSKLDVPRVPDKEKEGLANAAMPQPAKPPSMRVKKIIMEAQIQFEHWLFIKINEH